MSNDRKLAFVVYDNWAMFFNGVTDEEAGQLIKAVFYYHNNGEPQKIENPAIKTAYDYLFSMIETDAKRYAEKCEKNRRNAERRKERENTIGVFNEAIKTDR